MTSVAYTDANIWVTYLLEEEPKIRQVEEVIESIENGQRKVVLSSLVVLEVLDVIRKRIIEKENAAAGEREYNRAMSEIQRNMTKFVKVTTALSQQGKIIFSDSSRSVAEMLTETLKISNQMVPSAVPWKYCKICNKPLMPHRTRHGGVGHYDIQHSLTAVECNCDELISTDQWLDKLRGTPDFESLTFVIL